MGESIEPAKFMNLDSRTEIISTAKKLQTIANSLLIDTKRTMIRTLERELEAAEYLRKLLDAHIILLKTTIHKLKIRQVEEQIQNE